LIALTHACVIAMDGLRVAKTGEHVVLPVLRAERPPSARGERAYRVDQGVDDAIDRQCALAVPRSQRHIDSEITTINAEIAENAETL